MTISRVSEPHILGPQVSEMYASRLKALWQKGPFWSSILAFKNLTNSVQSFSAETNMMMRQARSKCRINPMLIIDQQSGPQYAPLLTHSSLITGILILEFLTYIGHISFKTLLYINISLFNHENYKRLKFIYEDLAQTKQSRYQNLLDDTIITYFLFQCSNIDDSLRISKLIKSFAYFDELLLSQGQYLNLTHENISEDIMNQIEEVSLIIISYMGGNESIVPSSNFREEQWQSAPIATYTRLKDPYYGSNFKVLMNRLNRGLEVQQYDLTFTADADYRAYCTHINWRTSSNYVVAPKYVRHMRDSALCSSFQYASVFFERTPVRLYEIQDISLDEGLYILYAAIQGFQQLFEQFGYFQIEADLICFSREGLVRVWANRNLSKSGPEHPNTHPSHPYCTFFSKLLTIVEKLIDFQGKPTISHFMQRRKLKQPLHNLMGVLQLYIKEAGMIIPRYLASIRSLCSGTKRNKNQGNSTSSFVFSSNCHSSNSHHKNAEETNSQPTNYYSPPSSLHTPFRRSHELHANDLHSSKRFTFVPSNHLRKQSPLRTLHKATPDSPKNFSYSTEEEVVLKSRIYSIIDAPEQEMKRKEGLRQVSAYLDADGADIDPDIAADMLRMAQSTF